MIVIGCGCLLVSAGLGFAETGAPALNDVPRHAPSPTVDAAAGDGNAQPAIPPRSQPITANSMMDSVTARSYDPSGRRDPFAPVLQLLGMGPIDPTLPPLQRIGLTEMNLIAVIWGAYGYTAMVQTPDGNGYSVRRGTRIGPNNGVVSAVTEKGIVVQERFTDVYGTKQEREYVKLLHPKEGAE